MGDARFDRAYDKVRRARAPQTALRLLDDEEVVHALAAASVHGEPVLANVLATEALNRIHRLRAALACLGEGVLALTLRGEVRWANPTAERLLDLKREDMIGRDLHTLVEHLDTERRPVPAESCAILNGVDGALAADGEHLRRRDGSLLCVTYTSAPVLDASGDPMGIVLAFTDCSERLARMRETEEARERYMSLFRHAPIGMVSIGVDSMIQEMNPAAETLTGRAADESRGVALSEFLHPDDLERLMGLFANVVGGAHEEAEVRVRHKDGHYIRVAAQGVPIVVRGEVVGVFGLMQPLT